MWISNPCEYQKEAQRQGLFKTLGGTKILKTAGIMQQGINITHVWHETYNSLKREKAESMEASRRPTCSGHIDQGSLAFLILSFLWRHLHKHIGLLVY